MDRAQFETVVVLAMLAPSAHNSQPARWVLREGVIELSADLSRGLPVGDPTGRDLEVSCGAAVEGTVLALAAQGVGARVTLLDIPAQDGLRPIARIEPQGFADPGDTALAAEMRTRLTHRAGFIATDPVALDGLKADHMTLVTEAGHINWLAEQIDVASARIMTSRAFRSELLQWMRLSRGDPNYDIDGLNREVLAIDAVTARLIRPVLASRAFDLLYALGLGPTLSGEAARSRAAGAIALFHWPVGQSYVSAGRAFYRSWLQASARRLVGWPAAALADDPSTRGAVSDRFGIPDNRVLFNTLRLGMPNKATPSRARLSLRDVIV